MFLKIQIKLAPNTRSDDYLTKPFFLSELNARIKSLIRRLNVEENKKMVLNELTIFPEEMRVLVHNKKIDLTTKEFSLLLYFTSNQNRVLSKTVLGEYMSSSYDDYGFTDDLVQRTCFVQQFLLSYRLEHYLN